MFLCPGDGLSESLSAALPAIKCCSVPAALKSPHSGKLTNGPNQIDLIYAFCANHVFPVSLFRSTLWFSTDKGQIHQPCNQAGQHWQNKQERRWISSGWRCRRISSCSLATCFLTVLQDSCQRWARVFALVRQRFWEKEKSECVPLSCGLPVLPCVNMSVCYQWWVNWLLASLSSWILLLSFRGSASAGPKSKAKRAKLVSSVERLQEGEVVTDTTGKKWQLTTVLSQTPTELVYEGEIDVLHWEIRLDLLWLRKGIKKMTFFAPRGGLCISLVPKSYKNKKYLT